MTDGPDEFPTGEELPDESVDTDDIDPFIVDDDAFDDVNDWAIAEWLVQQLARGNDNDDDDETDKIRDTIERLAEDSSASAERIEELLDVDAIREGHSEVTEEALRQHIASVEQLDRVFEHHFANPDSQS